MTQVASRRRATPTALAFLAALVTASAPVAQTLKGGVVENDNAPTTQAAGGQCGDDSAYNKLYGVQGVMLTQDQADAATGNPGVYRCGGCDGKPNMEECWLKPRAEPPVAIVAQTLHGSARQTFNNGGANSGYPSYPPPRMVGVVQRTGAPANGTAKRTQNRTPKPAAKTPTDTVRVTADGWPLSIDIPRKLPLNQPFTAALSKPTNSNSPWTTAQIKLLRRKTATSLGIVQFVALFQGSNRFPENFKATF
jgi:hypothetical protein